MASAILGAIWALTLFNSLVLGIPLNDAIQTGLSERRLEQTSRVAAVKRISHSGDASYLNPKSYNTVVRPTNQNTQHVIEVSFNNVPRYLLLDTGSADTWMITQDFQCLDANFSSVPSSDCAFGDPYTGPKIAQIQNETYLQDYGTGEVLSGIFGYADVAIAGLTTKNQKVAVVNRGYGIGDHVRSGVVGLAPRAVTRLYENTNASTSAPNGTVTPYSPIFESMYEPGCNGEKSIAPLFSLALQRGDDGGYIALGGLPPVASSHEFVFAPFEGMNYYGKYEPDRYYPIQPQGFEFNGVSEGTTYRAIIDSGTAANRLPQSIADRVNSAL